MLTKAISEFFWPVEVNTFESSKREICYKNIRCGYTRPFPQRSPNDFLRKVILDEYWWKKTKWLSQSAFKLIKCQNIYSSTQNPVVLSNSSAVSHRFCCQVEHYYLVHFTGSWLVKLLWFLTNSQNLIWETSWGTLLFFFTYCIHGNFLRQIHCGKIGHTQKVATPWTTVICPWVKRLV